MGSGVVGCRFVAWEDSGDLSLGGDACDGVQFYTIRIA